MSVYVKNHINHINCVLFARERGSADRCASHAFNLEALFVIETDVERPGRPTKTEGKIPGVRSEPRGRRERSPTSVDYPNVVIVHRLVSGTAACSAGRIGRTLRGSGRYNEIKGVMRS